MRKSGSFKNLDFSNMSLDDANANPSTSGIDSTVDSPTPIDPISTLNTQQTTPPANQTSSVKVEQTKDTVVHTLPPREEVVQTPPKETIVHTPPPRVEVIQTPPPKETVVQTPPPREEVVHTPKETVVHTHPREEVIQTPPREEVVHTPKETVVHTPKETVVHTPPREEVIQTPLPKEPVAHTPPPREEVVQTPKETVVHTHPMETVVHTPPREEVIQTPLPKEPVVQTPPPREEVIQTPKETVVHTPPREEVIQTPPPRQEVKPRRESKKIFLQEIPKREEFIKVGPVKEIDQVAEENKQQIMDSISAITQTDDLDNFEINSDSDLANFIIQQINREFVPFWRQYLTTFDRTKFTQAGKDGWDMKEDSRHRQLAREPINQLKNLEYIRLCRISYTNIVTDTVFEKVSSKIVGVSRKLVRRGVRKHIRLMISDYIFG